ncbi:helix-turn-helix transcriptional regulator [Viridibacillus sp. NPDC096237]|uniref:helix-turn-helix transcriptional regulator n=1 Tax=Viridibacillus sp. NPDC096237 TaxID=3390721 RepID=UPI003CFE6706
MTPRKWLKEIRFEKSMTQQDVAERAHIERSYYTMIEQGKRTPSVQVAMDISKVLNFSWTIFFDNECNELTQKQLA